MCDCKCKILIVSTCIGVNTTPRMQVQSFYNQSNEVLVLKLYLIPTIHTKSPLPIVDYRELLDPWVPFNAGVDDVGNSLPYTQFTCLLTK
jgi:hypothetical protein